MIYTVTVNPSLDYLMYLSAFQPEALNRSQRETHLAGGKGLNVSRVLHALGTSTTCLGFVAGYVGTQIQYALDAEGLSSDFLALPEGCTRINVKVKCPGGRETEINGNGPEIDPAALTLLKNRLHKLTPDDILVLSGSVPASVAPAVYAELGEAALKSGAQLVVDAEKKLLFPALACHPLFVKPNLEELQDMLGQTLTTPEDIRDGMAVLQQKGAANVLLSNGKYGAYFLSQDGIFQHIPAPQGTVVNTVGSGDSMVAGFLHQYSHHADLLTCARYAVAAGSACAFKEDLPVAEDIDAIFHTM